MIRRRTITSYVWNSVSGNKMVILSNCIRNFFRKFELLGNSVQSENPSPDNPQEIKSAGRFDEASGKYLLDVKVTGRNILSDVGDTYNVFVPCSIKAGTTVTLITNGAASAGGNIKLIRENKEIIWMPIEAGKTKTTKTIPVNIVGFINALNPKDGLKYCLVIGDADNYEPYTEQTVQIALDEPLRGVGDYKDIITKDGVVRKIAHEVGNINCEFYDFVADENFYKIVFTPKYAPKNDKYYTIQCNISPHMVIYEGNPLIYWLPTTEEIKGMGIDIKGTMKDANAKLLDYLFKNPIELQYALETPVTELLPEFVQQQLQALHSENGTTHVFVDSGEVEAGINIEYKYKS